MNEIKEMGERLRAVGKEYQIEGFLSYANELQDFASVFDIESIDQVFTQISEDIKRIIQTSEEQGER